MKRYIKDGIIKTRNQIVIKGQRTIKDKDGNDKVVSTNTYNPTEEMILADGWVEYVPEPVELAPYVKSREEIVEELVTKFVVWNTHTEGILLGDELLSLPGGEVIT